MSAARWARIGFALAAWLFAGLAVVQVYLAGSAVIDLGGSGNFELHRNFGYLIGVLTLLLIVLALAGRMPLRVIAASALLLGLMIVQSILVAVKGSSPNIAALHPVNGFLIVTLAWWLAWRSVGYIRAPLPPEKPRPIPAPLAPPASPSGKPDEEEQ